jgi:uncharacterized membrane protein YfcA
MDSLQAIVAEFGVETLILVALAAFVTSCIHGAVGLAGGFLMTAILALLIGVRPSVPVMSVALIISHSSRALMNFRELDAKAFAAVMIPALPLIALSAYVYVELPVNLLAFVLAGVILLSIPLRHWAMARKIRAGYGALAGAGAAYGALAGTSVGSGLLLSPFLLGHGVVKEGFVATMAVIALVTNITRISVFGGTDVLTSDYLVLGLLVGLIMIPGNWVGHRFLRRMSVTRHGLLVDAFAAIGGLNFLYLGFTA